MNVFQAIYTSAVNTLENRQGLGRVFCSRSLPEPIRERIGHYEYDSDAEGEAIYSFERMDLPEGTWLLLNKAVPEVDYTGRTSCVSHTLAFLLEDLCSMLESWEGPVPTVFEFSRNFKWRTATWKDEPRWETEEETLTLQAAFESVRANAQDHESDRAIAPLLAFESVDNGPPKPKRAAWRFSERNPDEILDYFNQVWFCLDPWLGDNKYAPHLEEPDMGRISSWACTFATNLRNNRPDPYQWVVLSPKVPHMGSREILDPAAWQSLSDEEISSEITKNGIPGMLVERIQEGPENWARKKLAEKEEGLKEAYQTQVKERHSELGEEVQNLLDQLAIKISESNRLIQEAQASRWYIFSNNNVVFLDGLKAELSRIKEKAQDASKDLFEEFSAKVDPIRTLLGNSSTDDGDRENNPVFENETKRMEDLGGQWMQIAPLADLYNLATKLRDAHEELDEAKRKVEQERDAKAGEISKLQIGNKNLNYELRKLQTQQLARTSVTNKPWFWPAGLGLTVILLGLLLWRWNPESPTEASELNNIKNKNHNLLVDLTSKDNDNKVLQGKLRSAQQELEKRNEEKRKLEEQNNKNEADIKKITEENSKLKLNQQSDGIKNAGGSPKSPPLDDGKAPDNSKGIGSVPSGSSQPSPPKPQSPK